MHQIQSKSFNLFCSCLFFYGSGSTEKRTSFGMFQRHGGNLLFGCCLGKNSLVFSY